MGGFLSSLRSRISSASATPRRQERTAPPAHRTGRTRLDREVTVGSASTGGIRSSGTTAGRAGGGGTPLLERRIRRNPSPEVSTFLPPQRTQVAERQSSGTNSGHLQGSQAARIPTAEHETRPPTAEHETRPPTAEHETRPPTPQAAADGVEGVPEEVDPFAWMSAEDAAVRRELMVGIKATVRHGYAKRVIAEGHPDCANPVSERTFLEILRGYYEGMGDLHARFPALRTIEPPSLSQEDPTSKGVECKAKYQYEPGAMLFASDALDDSPVESANPFQYKAPREPGIKGVLAHEYGHHLSSERVVPRSIWQPKLEAMLTARGLLAAPRGLHSNDARFAVLVGKQARELGIGAYAGVKLTEFAAEAIRWRMHPEYGQTEDAPRMPSDLEDWVHDCFPFLDNGQIPENSVPFNPDSIKEPVMVDGEVEWIRRDALRSD